MELSDAVAQDLAALTDALDEPGADLELLVQRLGESCALAVGSYLGFSITLVVGGTPIGFSVLEEFLDPREIVTSAMVPPIALGAYPTGSEVVLYAGTAGAFVDLAADLNYALGSGREVVALDDHLWPPDPARGAAGLRTMSLQNQAVGVLLDRGYDHDDALVELRALAGRDGISLEMAVQQVLDSIERPGRD